MLETLYQEALKRKKEPKEEVEAVLQARQGKQSRIHDRPEIDQY